MSLDWINAQITQGFGPTSTKLDGPYQGYSNFNKGLDFSLPIGTPIGANVSGTVVSAGDSGDGWGISVKIRDAEGNVHNYGHLAGVNVQPGQQVTAGTVVGASGNSGKSTGPHLSYDVRTASGEYVEPSRWVNGVGAGVGGGIESAPPPDFSQYDVAGLPFSTSDYYTRFARWQALDLKVQQYEDAFNQWDASGGADLGIPEPDLSAFLAPEEVEEYRSLDADLLRWETAYDQQGEDLDRLITILDYHAKTDPRLTDAVNAQNQWNREMDIREEARLQATSQMQEETERQDLALANNQLHSQRQTVAFVVPKKKMASYDDLFAQAQERIRGGLPEVPGEPYAPQLPAGIFGKPQASAIPESRRARSAASAVTSGASGIARSATVRGRTAGGSWGDERITPQEFTQIDRQQGLPPVQSPRSRITGSIMNLASRAMPSFTVPTSGQPSASRAPTPAASATPTPPAYRR